MQRGNIQCEVMTFTSGFNKATVATSGERTAVHVQAATFEMPSLKKAIAWLESHGYSIKTDEHEVY